jgi:Flp pilus assembly pilin Flp
VTAPPGRMSAIEWALIAILLTIFLPAALATLGPRLPP